MKLGRAFGIAASMAFAGLALSIGAAEPAAKRPAEKENAAAALLAVPKIPERVAQLMQDRNYAEAVKAIEEAARAKDAPRDYLAYLKGRALQLNGQFDAAVAQYAAMQKEFPASPWLRRARFGQAVALARKGDFQAAEQIYRAEVDYLLSADRKQEIADIYLEFAEAYFKPKDELEHKPDYAKALGFYGQALEVGPKPARRMEIELQMARCQQLLNQLPDAAARYTQFIKDHPDAPSLVEARYRLGEVQQAQNQPEEARRTWQDLLAAHPDSKSDLIPKAAFNLSVTYALPNPSSDEDLNLGVAALESFLKRYPDHKLAPQAYLRIAGSYVARGRFDDAVKSLRRFLAEPRYADREELADARSLLGRSYQLQRKFPEALAAWREYLVKHPSHSAWSDVQRQIVDTEYFMAEDRAQAKKYDEARKLWGEFLARYPLDPRDPNILYQFGLMHFIELKYPEAIADWRRLVSKYPGTDESSLGQLMIATTLERRLGKLDEALVEYRKLTWGSFAPQAQLAVARLTEKNMGIVTERIFRTGEMPKIKLTSRNIESVTVRVYRVDLETYFRKMHAIHGVEGLNIALIDPDKTFEFKVPKYAEYQELESQIDVPLPPPPAPVGKEKVGAANSPPFQGGGRGRVGGSDQPPQSGAIAVTISSKTLEATTLVLQSDLDLIVKSSRDELFVFAENMRTGQAWPKARLLLSNGKQVFAEAATGDDGVFKQSYKELKEAGDVRVLALADSSAASNVVSLEGIGAAEGLADKGYIYTDRPAYRAGQLVHVRGVLRRAVDDNYTIEHGKKFTLDVFDPRNRSVWQENVTLSEFGTFHARFVLPATSPVGDYRVAVHDDDGRTDSGTFQVHEYQLEPVRLTVDTGRRVYYRGEQIEGTIRAAFYYGAPLAGREITYQLAGGRSFTAKTDDKGEIHFKLPTREFRESQKLPLVVTLAERNLQTTQNFILATQGFAFSLSTVRPVFIAGESFEVSIKATDAEGKPLAQKLTLNVLERTVVEGRVGENPIEHFDLTTAAKDGTVRQTLHLEKGARYILRAEGIDRFGNPVSGQQIVQISDDSDRVRLRILADRHTFKVGDKADVQLVWREEPALALVTFQGARVLDYRLVRLEKGVNKLALPMTAKHAPNFDLTVSVMTDPRPPAARPISPLPLGGEGAGVRGNSPPRRFHEAASPFAVQREMQVVLTPKRKPGAKGPIQPGEELELTIRATDPQGRPVSAELSLAMVEQSLLGLFGVNIDPIDDFFRAGARQSALRTSTSAIFAYYPITRPIDRHLLAEAERTAIAAVEKERRTQITPRIAIQEESEAKLLNADSDTMTAGIQRRTRQRYRYSADLEENESTGGENTDGGDAGLDSTGLTDEARIYKDVFDERDLIVETLGVQTIMTVRPSQSTDAGRPVTYPDRPNWEALTQSRSHFSVEKPGYGGNGDRSPGKMNLNTSGFDYTAFDSQSEYLKTVNVPNARVYPVEDLVLPFKASLHSPGVHQDTQADFDSLIDLITATVSPDGWKDAGGAGPGLHDTNMTLVVSQTQDVQSNLNLHVALGDNPDQQRIAELAHKLVKDGAILLPQRGPQETGYWNPGIVTDGKGEATVTITMPDQSTAWKLSARGITTDTLAGEAESELVVKKELFGELKLPLAFTDGDEAQIPVSIHNDLLDKGPIEVTLKTTVGAKSVEEHQTIDVKAKGLAEIAFRAAVRRPAPSPSEGEGRGEGAAATFELTIKAGGKTDTIRRSIPIHPYGLAVYATAGGSATADTTVWVAAAPQMPVTAPNLQIIVGPTVQRSLMDVLFGPVPACQLESQMISSGIDTTTSDLLAALALQKLLGTTRDATGPEAAALDGRIRSAISGLVSSQQEKEGGWSWSGYGGECHRFTSARAVWALALARRAGYKIPDDRFERAVTYLQSQIATTGENDYASKAILLHALSVAGQGDFTLANRLYRNRPALGNAALAHLALALVEMDRRPMAEDLLKLLDSRSLDGGGSGRASSDALPWNDSAVEVRALYALAQEQLAPEAPKTKELIDWLMAHRTGNRWSPDKATGPATMALAGWFGKSRAQAEHYSLTMFVNDLRVKTLDIDKETGTQTIDVPAKLLKPGKQRINFQLTGRGEYAFQAILGGFVEAGKLKSTTNGWSVARHHEPAPLELDGQEIPRGFDVLEGSFKPFRNPLTKLAIGRRGHRRPRHPPQRRPGDRPDDQLEYMVVTEPLASGTTVIEKSISGGFEQHLRNRPRPDHLLRRQPALRRTNPVRYSRLRGGPISGRSDCGSQRLSARSDRGFRSEEVGRDDSHRGMAEQSRNGHGKGHSAVGRQRTGTSIVTAEYEKWERIARRGVGRVSSLAAGVV